MKIFKFEMPDPELKFSDLDQPYQFHFIKEFILAGVGLILGIILCIIIQKFIYIPIIIAIALGYCIYVCFQIYKSLMNQVLVIDAKCIDLERKETRLLGSFSKDATTSKTCTLILENESGLKFRQAVAYSSSYKTGDVVRIYANEGSISQLNQNTYTVVNPIFMHTLRT